MNGISSQKIHNMDVGLFWKHNEPILKKLERQRMPPRSRLVYKDISTKHSKSKDTFLAQYDLVNFYDNRKNLLKILVEFRQDLSIKKEEIIARNGHNAQKTTIDGSKVTSSGHIAWLRNMAKRMVAGDALR